MTMPSPELIASFAAIVGDKDVRDLKRADVIAWITAEQKSMRNGKRYDA